MTGTEVRDIPLDQVQLSETNTRRDYENGGMPELVESVKAKGIVQPILVRPVAATSKKAGHWEVVAGHRRVVAARKAGLDHIPALVRELTDQEALELQVIENLHREDLHPLEEAEGYRRLMKDHGYTVERLAGAVNKSTKYVYDRVKLLALIPEAKRLFFAGKFEAAHAIILARLKPEDQKRAIDPRADRFRPALFVEDHAGGELFSDGDQGEKEREDPYHALKAVSEREFQRWVNEHVRFEPVRVDPMLFPDAAAALDAAKASKAKVVAVTSSHYLQPETRDEDQRTYGPASWKRADGEAGSRACEHSVTGFVAAGPGRGEAFLVCIAKDKCEVHWKAEQRERAANRKARAKGSGIEPARPEKKEDPELTKALEAAHEAAEIEVGKQVAAAAAKLTANDALRLLAYLGDWSTREAFHQIERYTGVKVAVAPGDKALQAWCDKAPLTLVQQALLISQEEFTHGQQLAVALGVDADAVFKAAEKKAREIVKAQKLDEAKKLGKPETAKKAKTGKPKRPKVRG
jgi:ParB/RepB/Spo0J family partition protein